MIIKLDKSQIEKIDLISKYPEIKDSNLISSFGNSREHYKLLYKLSSYFNNTIIFDIGTHRGMSALATAQSNNKIVSYDILDIREKNINFENYSNIEFKIENGLENCSNMINSSMIVLDIDPKGVYELNFIHNLYSQNYKGILVIDNIYDEQLKKIWNIIPYPKFDISIYGHFNGTGLVVYNEDIIFQYE